MIQNIFTDKLSKSNQYRAVDSETTMTPIHCVRDIKDVLAINYNRYYDQLTALLHLNNGQYCFMCDANIIYPPTAYSAYSSYTHVDRYFSSQPTTIIIHDLTLDKILSYLTIYDKQILQINNDTLPIEHRLFWAINTTPPPAPGAYDYYTRHRIYHDNTHFALYDKDTRKKLFALCLCCH